jgi:transglutaminase-like putative cysteine protease
VSGIRYNIRHRTTYRYSQPVSISHHAIRLVPRNCSHQVRRSFLVSESPAAAVRSDSVDYFGNPVTFMTVQAQHMELVIEANSCVDVELPPRPSPGETPAWETIFQRLQASIQPDDLAAIQYCFDSPLTMTNADVAAFARQSFLPSRPVLEAALDLTRRIHEDFKYDAEATTVTTAVDDVVRIRRGVCQDFAHLQLACLRALAVPARYVSGYLLTHPPPGKEKLIGSDASHAWVSVWCGDAGWIDLDPTNNSMPAGEHITLAWGRDYGDVSPINGVIFGGGEHRIDVAVDVTPVTG